MWSWLLSRWFISVAAHTFHSVGLLVSRGASERDVLHHYLECESVWSLQFGLYSMAWGSCTLSDLGGPLHWSILARHLLLSDHPDSDGRTVLDCHSCRKGPRSITAASDIIPRNSHQTFSSCSYQLTEVAWQRFIVLLTNLTCVC